MSPVSRIIGPTYFHTRMNTPAEFPAVNVADSVDRSSMRWTVDTAVGSGIRPAIWLALGSAAFGWRDVVALLDCHPEWLAINQHVSQKPLQAT